MKIFYVTYYNGNAYQLERIEADESSTWDNLKLPVDDNDLISIIELPSGRCMIANEDGFVEVDFHA